MNSYKVQKLWTDATINYRYFTNCPVCNKHYDRNKTPVCYGVYSNDYSDEDYFEDNHYLCSEECVTLFILSQE